MLLFIVALLPIVPVKADPGHAVAAALPTVHMFFGADAPVLHFIGVANEEPAGAAFSAGDAGPSTDQPVVAQTSIDNVLIDPAEAYEPSRAARFPDPLHAHIDAYWADRFQEAGRTYRSPGGVVGFTNTIETGCGLADAAVETAFYCVLDETIYYSVTYRDIVDENIGDYGWVVVVAHEWGHHVQRILGYDVAMLPYQTGDLAPVLVEKQADCLAGAYTDIAELSGWLDPGDVNEGIRMTELSGDPAGTAIQLPTAHGSGSDRVAAFLSGYELGLDGCSLPF